MRLLNSFHEMARWAAAHRPGFLGRSKHQRRLGIKPNLSRRSLLILLAALAGVFVWRAGLTSAGDGPDRKSQTYTVLVGAEDVSSGGTVAAFFPDTLTIHVGDTVHWQRNAHEFHTVTFLANMDLPPFLVSAPPGLPSPLMRNPLTAFPVAPADGRYDGSGFATSGVFGPDGEEQYEVDSFDLTFTTPGTYNYVCVVHGARMSGQVVVVDRHEHVQSPHQVDREAQRAIAQALAQIPEAVAQAEAEVLPPTQNDDGTTTYYVLVGYAVGQLDVLRFFPDDLTVHPGDRVEWMFSMEDMAPHTISFLNGSEDPANVIPIPQDDGPPLLVLNPEIYYPQNADQPLTRDDVYTSGRLVVTNPPPSFALTIGDISGTEVYQCELHDDSGMVATLQIVPR
jgi:plastocyanin